MARIKKGFTYGRIGNLTYSVRNGVQIVKSITKKPKCKKTVPMKDSSTVFGKASNLGFYFRLSMSAAYNDFHDSSMSSRLTGLIVESFKPTLDETNQNFIFKQNSFKRLEGFEFNIKSPLQNYLFAQIMVDYTVENQVKVSIPEMKSPQEFVFPKDLQQCKFVVSQGLFDLENGFASEPKSQLFDIQKEYPKTIIPAQEFVFETKPGCLCMIAISLQFYKPSFAGDLFINTKQFNPSAILSAQFADGPVDITSRTNWDPMDFKVGRQRMLPPPIIQLLLGSPNTTAI